MSGKTDNHERPRGRPRRDQRGDVPDELMRALHDALAHKSADEITLREIAAAAGTSAEMVRYYFNGRDGLIAALLDAAFARVRARLQQMTVDLAAADHGHSRIIAASLWDLYFAEREAAKLFNSEFARSRPRPRDKDRSGRANAIIEVLHGEITSLQARGIYKADLEPARAAILIMSLTGCPVRLLETLPRTWISEDLLRQPSWVDDATVMIDSLCRA